MNLCLLHILFAYLLITLKVCQKFYEAAACGRAIITTMNQLSRRNRAWVNWIVGTFTYPKMLANALEYLAINHLTKYRFCRWASAQELFDINSIVENHLSIYNNCWSNNYCVKYSCYRVYWFCRTYCMPFAARVVSILALSRRSFDWPSGIRSISTPTLLNLTSASSVFKVLTASYIYLAVLLCRDSEADP